MAYFDSIVNAWFRPADEGKEVFCPYGILGSCYAVSGTTASRIRRFLRLYVISSVVVGAVAARLPGIWILAVLAVLVAVYAATMVVFLRGASRRGAAGLGSLAETTNRMGEAMGLGRAIGLLTFGLVMLIFSVIAMTLGELGVGIVGGLFAAAVTVHSIALVRGAATARRARRL